MKFSLKYYLPFLVLFAFVYANGQSDNPRQEYLNSSINERKFDERKWEEITKDFDYSEKVVEDYDEEFDSLQTNPNANKDSSQSSGNGGFSSAFWANVFQIVLITIVAGVIVVLLINMIGGGNLFAPRSRRISRSSTNFSIEKIENNIHETDLDRYIRKAVEEKKFVLAIRLYYLAIIKELSLSKMIKWKRDKTNRSYLNEIRSTSLFNPFRDVTRIFERVWYGQGSLDEKEYLSIKPKFEQLIKATQAEAPTIETD